MRTQPNWRKGTAWLVTAAVTAAIAIVATPTFATTITSSLPAQHVPAQSWLGGTFSIDPVADAPYGLSGAFVTFTFADDPDPATVPVSNWLSPYTLYPADGHYTYWGSDGWSQVFGRYMLRDAVSYYLDAYAEAGLWVDEQAETTTNNRRSYFYTGWMWQGAQFDGLRDVDYQWCSSSYCTYYLTDYWSYLWHATYGWAGAFGTSIVLDAGSLATLVAGGTLPFWVYSYGTDFDFTSATLTFTPNEPAAAPVAEPATLLLLGAGLAGLNRLSAVARNTRRLDRTIPVSHAASGRGTRAHREQPLAQLPLAPARSD